MAMAKLSYEALSSNNNVQFKQGTQQALNALLPGGASAGQAIEGAFYLTTDTHRLYIGRKVKVAPTGSNPHNISVGDVFPEEISTGIATVADNGALADVQLSGEMHEGDFYYIKSSNVLAVYEDDIGDGHPGWQQINSPTGIDRFEATIGTGGPANDPAFSSSSDYIKITEALLPDGAQTATSSEFWLKAGDNVTLKASANNVVEISSANSQSTLSLTESNATANKVKVTLSDNVNNDSNLYFIGAQDTTASAVNTYEASTDTSVIAHKAYYTRTGSSEPYTYTLVTNPTGNPSTSGYYERESAVKITGPGIQGTVINALGDVNSSSGASGFKFAVSVKNGETNTTQNRTIETNDIPNSIINPVIRVGNATTADVVFRGGVAKLPVYTKTETDTEITNAITNQLKGLDALHYRGTVSLPTDLANLNDGGLNGHARVSVGDVYKAAADFSFTQDNDTVFVKTGDILIAEGQEGSDGYINTDAAIWQVVPSGDEPILEGKFNTGTVSFGLEDKNLPDYNSSANVVTRLAKRPLWVQFDNNANSLISSAMQGSSADQILVTLNHKAPANYSANITNNPVLSHEDNNIISSDNNTSDSIADKVASFYAISGITRDVYGHVTAITGKQLAIKHNYMTSFSATHSATSNLGQINIGGADRLSLCNNATKAQVKIGSNSLTVTASDNNDRLNINLTWGSF